MTEPGIVIEIKHEQFAKAQGLIETTPSFMTIEVSQGISPLYLSTTLPIYTIPSDLLSYHGVFANAPHSIEVIVSGRTAEVKPVQPLKALQPIKVTEAGMETEVKPVQPSNAQGLIETEPSFMTTEVPQGISPLYLYATLPIYTIPSDLLSYHGVSANALSPIEVTEAEIVTEVRPEQPSKALSPIEVTESGMVIVVSLL